MRGPSSLPSGLSAGGRGKDKAPPAANLRVRNMLKRPLHTLSIGVGPAGKEMKVAQLLPQWIICELQQFNYSVLGKLLVIMGIDDKLDKLDDKGLGVIGLTTQLEDTGTKIETRELLDEKVVLQDAVNRLNFKNQAVYKGTRRMPSFSDKETKDTEYIKQHLQRFKEENHEPELELQGQTARSTGPRECRDGGTTSAGTFTAGYGPPGLAALFLRNLRGKWFLTLSAAFSRCRLITAGMNLTCSSERSRTCVVRSITKLRCMEAEKDRTAAEKSVVARTVAALEADLRRVKRDAEAFGRYMKLLRPEKGRLEAEQKEKITQAEQTKRHRPR
ncbi:hypothetical protein B0H11DRAFT_2248437 [Mycena galericulata]|nr:hypothetical protein B0H11DRAFT_2248437 [Mycena galericulata]